MELETEREVKDAKYIGIRHHYANGNDPRNHFICNVTGIIENPFTDTIMLKKEEDPGMESFGWELDKESWDKVRSDRIDIHIPPEAIMLLNE